MILHSREVNWTLHSVVVNGMNSSPFSRKTGLARSLLLAAGSRRTRRATPATLLTRDVSSAAQLFAGDARQQVLQHVCDITKLSEHHVGAILQAILTGDLDALEVLTDTPLGSIATTRARQHVVHHVGEATGLPADTVEAILHALRVAVI